MFRSSSSSLLPDQRRLGAPVFDLSVQLVSFLNEKEPLQSLLGG